MAKVIVGCKLPNGLMIQVSDAAVKINGANSTTIVGGYGLTEVDEAFWTQWKKEHADWPMVKNELIFAQVKPKDAEAAAEERRDQKTGLEQMKQKSDKIAKLNSEKD